MLGNELIEWLNNTDIKEIKQKAKQLEGVIEELDIDADQAYNNKDRNSLEKILDNIKEKKKVYRMIRGYYDVLFFAYEYFSDDKNEENETNLIPSGMSIEDAPRFHVELTSKLDELTTLNKRKKIGWGAPRGSGKSAYLSNIYPVHAVAYRTRRYILIISETASMSQAFLEFVSTNLKHNDKLRGDFGEVLDPNKKKNAQDNTEKFVTSSGIMVQASSMGGQLRGSRFKNARPDLVICDDLESARNTNTRELRDKNLHWFNSVVEPIGDPTKTALIYMGTLVHGQGLLPNVTSRPEYDSRIYSSVLSPPVNTELWEKFETMLRDAENPNRLIDAENFYYSNREAMDEGIEVLWPNRFDYLDLMKKKVDLGTRAFSSEYLNIPSDLESAVFKEEYFDYFNRDDLYRADGSVRPLDIYGFWDIAMGKNRRSDYNAIVIIGKEPRTGVIYVLEAWARKCAPHKAMEKVLELIESYRPKSFGVESIQAQYEFYRQVQQRAMSIGLYHTKIKPVSPKTKKEQRIEALEPLFEQGMIKIQKHQRLLEEMLIQYPSHDHDDLPDCLSSALGMTRIAKSRAMFYKPSGV